VAPFRDRRRRPVATFDDDDIDASFDEVSRCGETLWACSDDGNRKFGHHISSHRESSI
jgi:hypothetical protein